MIFADETIWVPCTKEEYEKSIKDLFPLIPCRRVPIYKNTSYGILEQIKFYGKEPDEWRYEKAVGTKRICMVSSEEANDKELMEFLKGIYK